MSLATRIAVMDAGTIRQIRAAPEEIYVAPGRSLRRQLHRLAGHGARQGARSCRPTG